ELSDQDLDDARKKQFQPLLDYMKSKLTEIKDVRLSKRLKESAVCLVADEGEMGAHMERLMARLGREKDFPASTKILEVNPDHPAVQAMQQLYGKDTVDARLEKYCRLLYDQAVIAEGSKVRDPLTFAKYINELLARDAAV